MENTENYSDESGKYRSFCYNLLNTKSKHPDCTVISFNWDLIVENELSKTGIKWSYSLNKMHSIPILKPHGSINWNGYIRENLRSKYPHYKPICEGSTISYDQMNPLENTDPHNINPGLRYKIYPGDPQAAVEDNDLKKTWGLCRDRISTSDSIVFIGYSLPSYDDYTINFFKQFCKNKNILVCDPSEPVLNKYQYHFGIKLQVIQSYFENSVFAVDSL